MAPDERQSPGPDVRAPLTFFAADEPTCMDTSLLTRPDMGTEVEAKRRFRELLKEFEEDRELRALYESVVIPLDEADGFEPDSFLWLARRIGSS